VRLPRYLIAVFALFSLGIGFSRISCRANAGRCHAGFEAVTANQHGSFNARNTKMKTPAKRNRPSHARKMLLESLEGRRMFDASGILDASEPEIRTQVIPSEVRLVNGTLRIDALVPIQNVTVTANGDKVTVASKGPGSMADVSFNRADVVDILFNGSEFDDIFVNDTDIDSIAFGRGGNDRLVGGSGNDDLFGGAGNDRLYGRGGVDLLLGQGGMDRLFDEDGNVSDFVAQPKPTPVAEPIVAPVKSFVKVSGDAATRSLNINQGGEVQIDLSAYNVKAVGIQGGVLSSVGTITHDATNNRLVTFKPAEGFSEKVVLEVTHQVVERVIYADIHTVYPAIFYKAGYRPDYTFSRNPIGLPRVVTKSFAIEVSVKPVTVATRQQVLFVKNAVVESLVPNATTPINRTSVVNPVSIPFVPEVSVAKTNPLRPTLLVLTQGANFNFKGNETGHATFDWQTNLGRNLTRDLEAAGSEVFTMEVQWNSLASNQNAVKDVAGKIREFLSNRQTQ